MALPVSPPPLNTAPLEFDEKTKRPGAFVSPWQQMMTNWWTTLRAPGNTVAPPATSNSPGIPGQIAYDKNFFYQCVDKNSWKRTALTAF